MAIVRYRIGAGDYEALRSESAAARGTRSAAAPSGPWERRALRAWLSGGRPGCGERSLRKLVYLALAEAGRGPMIDGSPSCEEGTVGRYPVAEERRETYRDQVRMLLDDVASGRHKIDPAEALAKAWREGHLAAEHRFEIEARRAKECFDSLEERAHPLASFRRACADVRRYDLNDRDVSDVVDELVKTIRALRLFDIEVLLLRAAAEGPAGLQGDQVPTLPENAG